METFSPKTEIINHFDNLINKVDIGFELCLERCNEKQNLGQIRESKSNDKRNLMDENDNFNIKLYNTIKASNNNIWPESTKVIDYLNQVRMQTIEELRKAQEESLEYFKLNSFRFKSQLTQKNSIDELRSLLFAEKYYCQIHCRKPIINKLCDFNIFIFVLDFYMSQSEIDSLEKLINAEKEPFCETPAPVFDEKMVLIGLLYKSFIENLSNFPSQIIHVSKQEVLNIESISFEYDFSAIELTNSTIDLSRLLLLKINARDDLTIRKKSVEVKLEGLSSLQTLDFGICSYEIYFSIRNFSLLKRLELATPATIDENMPTPLFDQIPNIEELVLNGNLSYFNLENLFNLKKLTLCGTICQHFNWELFKNLSYQLEELSICFYNLDYRFVRNILSGRNFTNLLVLQIMRSNMKKLEKKFIEQFPSLQTIRINKCILKSIEPGAFSSLKKLVFLDLSDNLFTELFKRDFSELDNLEYFYIYNNCLEFIEKDFFSSMKNLKEIDVEIK